MIKYTVVGIDSDGRHCVDHIKATSPDDALKVFYNQKGLAIRRDYHVVEIFEGHIYGKRS